MTSMYHRLPATRFIDPDYSYHGGKYTFLRWRGLSTANHGALFYTDPTVIADFQVSTLNDIETCADGLNRLI